MDIIIVTVCTIIGVVLWLLEIFLLPGISLGGIFGTFFMGGSVVYAYLALGSTAGTITLIVNVVLLVVGIFVVIKSRALDKISLDTAVEGKALETKEEEVAVGDEGETVSRLAPYGKALFNETIVEVKTTDAIIDSGVQVVVTHIEDNIVTVQPKV